MDLQFRLDQLENAELVRWSGLDTYAFNHTLTQEMAYRSLLKPQRRKLHRAAAQAYEELYPEQLDELAALLAEHYAEAEDDAKTLAYAARAGDAAARVYANAEAIAHYSQALEIVKRESHASERAGNGSADENILRDLYLRRGRAFELSGQYDRALRNYEEMKTLALERQDGRLELEALMASATLHSIPGPTNSPLQARGLSTQALALAQELGYGAAEAKIYWNLMLLEIWGGADRQRAIEYGEKSLALAREFGLRDQLAYTLHDLAMAHALTGHMDQAWTMQTEATKLWQELHNMPMYAESLNRAATVKFLTGELDKGISLAHDAYQLSQSIGNVVGEALASYMLSYANGMLGQYAQTIEYGRDSTRYAQESPVGAMGLSIQGYLAWVYGSNGQIERGIEIARQALKGVSELLLGKDERQLRLWSSFFRSVLIRLELLRGNLVGAQTILAQAPLLMAKDAFDMQSIDMYSIFVAVAELELAEADYAAAHDSIDRLIGLLKRFPIRLFFPDAYHLKGKILQAQELDERAVETWQAARVEAEAMNLRPTLWQILVALAATCDRQGRHAEAVELLGQARDIVHYIAEHSPADLRASFLALPQVQQVVDELAPAQSDGRES